MHSRSVFWACFGCKWAKNFNRSRDKNKKMSELEMSVLIMPEKMFLFFLEKFTPLTQILRCRHWPISPLSFNSLSNPAFKTVVENDQGSNRSGRLKVIRRDFFISIFSFRCRKTCSIFSRVRLQLKLIICCSDIPGIPKVKYKLAKCTSPLLARGITGTFQLDQQIANFDWIARIYCGV